MAAQSGSRRSQRLSQPVEQPKEDINSTLASQPPTISHETQGSTSAQPTVTPAKRKIEEVSIETAPVDNSPPRKSVKVFVKDENHWVLDGNIFLQLGDTRFKLYQCRLASESDWFRALIDQHSGKIPIVEEPHQDEIEVALQSADRVDGIDLFCLDDLSKVSVPPSVEQFGALLTAMERGIDYVYNPPPFKIIIDVFVASIYFEAPRYVTFAQTYFSKLFPSKWSSVKDSPSPLAVRTLLLALEHNELGDVLRHCYYDVARTHPLAPSDDTDEHPQITSTDLQLLGEQAFLPLMNLHRHLSLAWDRVRSLIDWQCAECGNTHKGSVTYNKTKKKYPFDPIIGIKTLLESDFMDVNRYCKIAKKEVKARLQFERGDIWDSIDEWVGIS